MGADYQQVTESRLVHFYQTTFSKSLIFNGGVSGKVEMHRANGDAVRGGLASDKVPPARRGSGCSGGFPDGWRGSGEGHRRWRCDAPR